jgi:hypothetical protein
MMSRMLLVLLIAASLSHAQQTDVEQVEARAAIW